MSKICVERRALGKRLVYYMVDANVEFWDQHWLTRIDEATYRRAEYGWLGEFDKPFSRHLPRQGKILEAGCGPGTIVVALNKRGYQCEGVEWSRSTVDAAHEARPDLPIWNGDVTDLQVEDGHYAGYISLGVVEHAEEGLEPFLAEAHRVLRDDGTMLLSVPYFHWLRRLKALLGFYQGSKSNLPFYQYAFSIGEMRCILGGAGFDVIETHSYSALKGIKDEIPVLARMVQLTFFRWSMLLILKLLPFVSRRLGHMVLFVCRKRGV